MKKFFKQQLSLLMMMVLTLAMSSVAYAAEGVADGTYAIGVTSNAAMFKVVDAKLNVVEGKMTAVITLSGTGYSKLFMGTKEDAEAASDSDVIHFTEDQNGKYTFEVPVSALDTEINVAAYAVKSEIWYDRTLTFHSDTLAPLEAQPKEAVVETASVAEEKWEQQAPQPHGADQKGNAETAELVAQTTKEANPKTGDSNMGVISTVIFLACVAMIAGDKKIHRDEA